MSIRNFDGRFGTRPQSRRAIASLCLLALAGAAYAQNDETVPGTSQAATPAEQIVDDGPRKLALLVTIADYSTASGWRDLASDRDLVVMTAALERQGFDEIFELADSDATRSGIEQAFGRLAELAAPGDVVMFHYSGHGQQITDDDHDELDGYDEALVPYDAPIRLTAGYQGEKHLRDDDLGAMLARLRHKVGDRGEVVVSLDSCYSGSATRGDARSRGSSKPFGEPQPREDGSPVAAVEEGGGYLEAASNTRGAAGGDGDGLAPIVALSAARHDEEAYEAFDDEGANIGSLSLALSSALAEAASGLTYRSLFERVKNLMASYDVSNTPQVEGSALDDPLFAGRAIEQDPFFRVLKTNDDGTLVKLAGGTVVGLLTGTRLEIYPAGTVAWKEAEATTSGRVTEAGPLKAIVELDSAVFPEDVEGAWAYVTQQSFGSLGITARFAGGDTAWSRDLKARLQADESGLVNLDGKADVEIREVTGEPAQPAGVVVDSTHGGYRLLGPVPIDAQLATEVVGRLKDYARNRYLRKLELQSEDYDVDLKLLPCRLSCDEFGESCECPPIPLDEVTVAGNLQLREGMGFELEIHHQGRKPAYVAVLDLMPTGEWSVLWPPPKQTPEPVSAGKTHKIDDLWKVNPPYGTDVLKVFASEDPINFEWLLGSRSRSEPRNPLERLFAEVLAEGEDTRGADSRKAVRSDAGVATASLTYEITSQGPE